MLQSQIWINSTIDGRENLTEQTSSTFSPFLLKQFVNLLVDIRAKAHILYITEDFFWLEGRQL